jgi:hypothetical protein
LIVDTLNQVSYILTMQENMSQNQQTANILNEIIATTGASKSQAISIAIKGLVDLGLPVESAAKAILGDNFFQTASDRIWETLNA